MSPRNAHCKGGSRVQKPFSTSLSFFASASLFSVLVAEGGDAKGGRERGREDPVLYYMVGSREMIGCFIKADRTLLVFVTSTNPNQNEQVGRASVCRWSCDWRGMYVLFPWKRAASSF